MVQINFAGKEILTKIVYYGPALCGKTTNLQVLHRMTDPERKTKLFSINTEGDRTLFFDLLPLSLGRIHGYRIKLQVYTVPGQVQYASTRRAVLAGTDAIVFVADSEQGKMEENLESLRDLSMNLPYNDLELENIPMVFQFNKRDLPEIMTRIEMEKTLNKAKRPSFESVAITGKGVMDTFIGISRLMINTVVSKYRLDRGTNGKVDFGQRLAKAMEEFRQSDTEDTNPVDLRSLQLKFESPTAKKTPDVGDKDAAKKDKPEAMSNADLIERAVSANMELANLYVKLDETKRERDARIKQLEAVTRIGETVTSVLDIDRLLNMLGKILSDQVGDCVCIALVEGRPPELKPRGAYRLKTDPIFLVRAEKGKSLAHLLAHQRRPNIVTQEYNQHWHALIKAKFPTIEGLISIPLISHRRLLGLVNIITTESKRCFEESDMKFYGATAQFLATAIENARLYGMVSNLNRGLEKKMDEIKGLNEKLENEVGQRTQELQYANRALQRANEELRLLDQTKDQFMNLVSQELRNPIATICRFIKDQAASDKPVNASEAKSILSQADGVKHIVSQLIELFNLENDTTPLEFTEVNLTQVVRRELWAHRHLINEKKIKVLTRFYPGLTVRGDHERLRQVFSHLIHNAVKFNPEGQDIRIWTDHREGSHLVYVRDHGPGIPANRRRQVFNKFQILQAETYLEDGLGLGLPISKLILEKHRGRIELLDPPSMDGQAEGGLLVRVVLPPSSGSTSDG